MNQDFKEFFASLNAHLVEFMVIGGVAYNYYAPPRATKDIDVWVNPDPANVRRLLDALAEFGFPTHGIDPTAFGQADSILMLGRVPNRIDVLAHPRGVDWLPCWNRRLVTDYGGAAISVLSIGDLIAAKRSAGRPQDLVDAEKLTKVGKSR